MHNSYIEKVVFSKNPFFKHKPTLNSLEFELTERCNNNCVHCCINLPAGNLDAKKKELSCNDIKSILKEAAALGCMSVRFTGGEPLLRKDFEEIYIFAKKLGLAVAIFTNATLITSRLVKLFKKYPPKELIEVSVYGMEKRSYEKATRAPSSFKKFKKGVALLLKNKIPFVVKSAFLPYNNSEIKEFRTWAGSIPWMDKPPNYSMCFDLRCRRDSLSKNREIKKYRISPEDRLKFLSETIGKDKYIEDIKDFFSRYFPKNTGLLFRCGAGIRRGCVDSYGNFQMCSLLRHPRTIYSLKNGTIKKALLDIFPKIRELKANDPDYLSRCSKCFLKALCEQCPAKSWMEHGTLDTPVEYLCDIIHAEARYAGLLKENEQAWEVKDWRARLEKFTGKKIKGGKLR